MGLQARIAPRAGRLPRITYRWDPETDILTGALKGGATGGEGERGLTGSVELEGGDGSFVLLDLVAGIVRGVEVVVWPDVKTVPDLQPPQGARDGQLVVPGRRSQPSVAAVEVETALSVEADPTEAVLHFRVGPSRPSECVRVAENLLIEVDEEREVAGLWLLEVPPYPPGEAPDP